MIESQMMNVKSRATMFLADGGICVPFFVILRMTLQDFEALLALRLGCRLPTTDMSKKLKNRLRDLVLPVTMWDHATYLLTFLTYLYTHSRFRRRN